MKRTILAVLCFLLGAFFAQADQYQSQQINVSGSVITITNSIQSTSLTLVYTIQGGPSTVSIAVQGCTAAASCTLLDTYTSAFNATRPLQSLSTAYSYFTVSATWIGGTNVSVTVGSFLKSPANSGGVPSQQVAPNSGVFRISDNCGTQTNCLNWVADDSTDNCGTALTNYLATINAYSGPGTPDVFISGTSTSAKAFKLATAGCHLEFDIPVNVHVDATIDCAQPATTANCFQFGQSGLAAQAFIAKSTFTGGVLTGGENLTNAGIEEEAYNTNLVIYGTEFHNFGAGHTAGGACSNWAIIFDPNVFEGTVAFTQWDMTDSTAGRCGYYNSGAPGENTVFFDHNTMGGAAGTGIPPTTCSNVGIQDGGYYGEISGNNIYGYRVDIRLQGIGTRERSNTLDAAGCANGTLKAPIQWGPGGNATATVGDFEIEGDNINGNTTHNTYLFAKAFDTNSSSVLQDVTMIGNQASGSGVIKLLDNSSCSVSNVLNGTWCYQANNVSIEPILNAGWCIGQLCGQFYASAQAANVSLSPVATSVINEEYTATCLITLTQAATTSSTLPTCTISWTDSTTNTTQTTQVTPTWASGISGCSGTTTNTVGNSCQGHLPIWTKAGTVVNVSTSGYASSGATPMQFQILAQLRGVN